MWQHDATPDTHMSKGKIIHISLYSQKQKPQVRLIIGHILSFGTIRISSNSPPCAFAISERDCHALTTHAITGPHASSTLVHLSLLNTPMSWFLQTMNHLPGKCKKQFDMFDFETIQITSYFLPIFQSVLASFQSILTPKNHMFLNNISSNAICRENLDPGSEKPTK